MNNVSTLLGKYGEWTFRILLITGITINLWLTSKFITRNEYEINNTQIKSSLETETKDVKLDITTFVRDNIAAHLTISTAIADISIAVKLLAANQLRLDDHETRLRIVERNQINVMSRLDAVEHSIDRGTIPKNTP